MIPLLTVMLMLKTNEKAFYEINTLKFITSRWVCARVTWIKNPKQPRETTVTTAKTSKFTFSYVY
jgi:hypothetical protein